MNVLDLDTLDLVVTAQLLGRVLDEETLRRLTARDHPDARPHHGYLFQHLVAGPMAIGQIAARMDVTQQAVSKTVADLERLGYVERRADPGDARIRLIALSPEGQRVIDDFREIRDEVADELAAALGPRRAEQMRKLMSESLVVLGAAPAIRDRNVRPREEERASGSPDV